MRWIPAVAVFALIAGVVYGQKVDQGRPGTQGPWPVTGTVVVVAGGSDGGFTFVAPLPCAHYAEGNTSVGAAATVVPATPQAGRIWVRICNSLLNTEGAQCVCSGTSTPTYAAASLGDQLAVSDCVLYNIGTKDAGVPQCICNGAGVRLTSAECVP